MSKWLLLAAVLALAFWWVSRSRGSGRGSGRGRGGDRSGAGDGAGSQNPEPMVVCAHCGVHLPRTEALVDTVRGHAYCGPVHRDAGPQ